MIKGRIFKAQSEGNLSQTKPMFAFVPSYLFKNQQFQEREYSLRGWDSINCGANKNAVGSHVFPDLSKPLNKTMFKENKDVLEFVQSLKRLMHRHTSRITEPKKPGRNQEFDESNRFIGYPEK
jgi:hypothetical protein